MAQLSPGETKGCTFLILFFIHMMKINVPKNSHLFCVCYLYNQSINQSSQLSGHWADSWFSPPDVAHFYFIFLTWCKSSYVSTFWFQFNPLFCIDWFTVQQRYLSHYPANFQRGLCPSSFLFSSSWFIANDNPVEGQRCSEIIHLME